MKIPPRNKKRDKLTLKQRLFVTAYVASRNATQAAIKAGYSAPTAASAGWRLLRKVEISEAIAEEIAKLFAKCEITVDNVLQEIAKLAFANMQDYIQVQPDGTALVDLSLLTREQAAAITELETTEYKGKANERESRKVRIKLGSKKEALDSLCKYALRLGDRLELTGTDGAPLIRPEVTLHIVDSPSS